jgi:hypothetical protein
MGEHIFFEEELFMKKGKKFFFGMAALLLGASLFFIGRDTPADGKAGDAGAAGPVNITTSASFDGFRAQTERAVTPGRIICLDSLTLPALSSGTEVADFKTANAAVAGALATAGTGNVAISVAKAKVTMYEGAEVNLADAAHFFIKDPGLETTEAAGRS